MSKEEYVYGWRDPRLPNIGWEPNYTYVVRPMYQIAWLPVDKYKVVKVYGRVGGRECEEVLAISLTREAADGFIKLLKEN